ncbi:hypothetical protein [Planctopirus limnophila]|uniref:hypothetical protein n=1 Tax=Planctopirus limnophila TaxID=120 RepID=UPI00030221CD|nr:hypothetical protein [Planctopirus limnophila]
MLASITCGCSSSTVHDDERPLTTFVRQGTGEAKEFRVLPVGEEQEWLPALWCPSCQKWQPMPPGDEWQRNPALRVCTKTKTALVQKP